MDTSIFEPRERLSIRRGAMGYTQTELEQTFLAEHEARLDLERMHEELKRTQSQLIHSAKLAALGQLVAGLAHEINNPLAIVSNNLAILQIETKSLAQLVSLYRQADDLLAENRPELLHAVRDLSERIDLAYLLSHLDSMIDRSRENLKRIQNIVKDLRDFGRSEDSVVELVHDLNPGIATTVNILKGMALKKSVTVRLDLGPLPPIKCAPTRIHHVVLNLVSNAIDASPPGSEVLVRTCEGPEGIEIHVIDHGSGIDPSVRDQIFNPFFTTKPPGKGTGLGLSTSYTHVMEHHGRISVDSTPGQGAHFTVYLPCQT